MKIKNVHSVSFSLDKMNHYTWEKVPIDEVENILVAPEQRQILKELLELPVKHKTVIYLHYVEGYSIKEISDILGITESAVKSRLLRGRKQMRIAFRMEGGM